jgi:hypothetical protein
MTDCQELLAKVRGNRAFVKTKCVSRKEGKKCRGPDLHHAYHRV